MAVDERNRSSLSVEDVNATDVCWKKNFKFSLADLPAHQIIIIIIIIHFTESFHLNSTISQIGLNQKKCKNEYIRCSDVIDVIVIHAAMLEVYSLRINKNVVKCANLKTVLSRLFANHVFRLKRNSTRNSFQAYRSL